MWMTKLRMTITKILYQTCDGHSPYKKNMIKLRHTINIYLIQKTKKKV